MAPNGTQKNMPLNAFTLDFTNEPPIHVRFTCHFIQDKVMVSMATRFDLCTKWRVRALLWLVVHSCNNAGQLCMTRVIPRSGITVKPNVCFPVPPDTFIHTLLFSISFIYISTCTRQCSGSSDAHYVDKITEYTHRWYFKRYRQQHCCDLGEWSGRYCCKQGCSGCQYKSSMEVVSHLFWSAAGIIFISVRVVSIWIPTACISFFHSPSWFLAPLYPQLYPKSVPTWMPCSSHLGWSQGKGSHG